MIGFHAEPASKHDKAVPPRGTENLPTGERAIFELNDIHVGARMFGDFVHPLAQSLPGYDVGQRERDPLPGCRLLHRP